MKKVLMHLSVFSLLMLPLSLKAASGTLENPLAANSVYEFLYDILKFIIQIGFPIVVLFLVWIGFTFVQSSATGNTEGLKKAKTNFMYALIGALLLLGAQALAIAIQGTVEDLQRGL